MKKQVNISVPNPCSADWQQMTPADKGRFCASCQKNVVDFTRSSDREIAAAFVRKGSICGQFRNDQLNRDLFLPKEKNRLWIAASVAVFGFLGLGSNQAVAQEPTASEQTPPSGESSKQQLAGPTTVTGKVTAGNETSGVEFAGISNKTAHSFALTDSNGNFSIEASLGDSIEVYLVGHETLTFFYDGNNLTTIQLVKAANPPHLTLGGAMLGAETKPAQNSARGIWQHLLLWNLFR